MPEFGKGLPRGTLTRWPSPGLFVKVRQCYENRRDAAHPLVNDPVASSQPRRTAGASGQEFGTSSEGSRSGGGRSTAPRGSGRDLSHPSREARLQLLQANGRRVIDQGTNALKIERYVADTLGDRDAWTTKGVRDPEFVEDV